MLTRREFAMTALAALLFVALAGCSESLPTDPEVPNCEGVSSTSTTAAGHSHVICIPDGDLSVTPASGRTYTTTHEAGHTHELALTQVQLQTIATGGTITVTVVGSLHNHNFTFLLDPAAKP